MRRLPRRRPSPALVVAIIALVVASAGTATAARVLIRNSSQVATGSINSSDLANGKGVSLADLTPRTRFQLTGEPGPLGPEGERGGQGPGGPRGGEGAPGTKGADGSAIAFAYVRADGTLEASVSKGVNSVARSTTLPTLGVYCFDLGPSPKNAVATVDFMTTTTGVETIYPALPGTASGGSSFIGNNCPAPQQDAAVVIANVLGSTAEEQNPPRGFWIAFN